RQLAFKNPTQADRAYQRLEAGALFDELAGEHYGEAYQQSPEEERITGPLSYLMEMDPIFAEQVWSIPEIGAYTKPFQTRSGWFIVQLVNVERNPLITETEFQTQGPGVMERIKARHVQAASDSLVRQIMQQANVQTEVERIRALHTYLLAADGLPELKVHEERFAPTLLDHAEEAGLDFNATLATYTYQDQTQAFTVGEYLQLLHGLNAREAVQATIP
ncbi:peptidylprolyl isomerase, partial [Arthrospira platensis SPKY1]|nr:peptidylprolyl isomerase [Arthrospira platensis SPKY1]